MTARGGAGTGACTRRSAVRSDGPVIDALLMKLRAREELSAREEDAIREAVGEEKTCRAHAVLIRAGEPLSCSTVLLEGFLCRFKDLEDNRQFTALHVSGDFADLHAFTLKCIDHNILALTDCRLGIVQHDRIEMMLRDHPRLVRLLWFLTNVDAAIHREWMLTLSLRAAIARVAHLFCELHRRLAVVGRAERSGYALGVTQRMLAKCLGMHWVHFSRVLKELRALGLADFRAGRVTISDRLGLERIAGFDPDYLYLDRAGG